MLQIELSAAEDGVGAQTPSQLTTPVSRLHPQLALWLVRGVLGATIVGIAMAFVPVRSAQPPLSQTAALAQPAQSEMTALLASATTGPEPEPQAAAALTPTSHAVQQPASALLATPVLSEAYRAKHSVARKKAIKPSRRYNRHRAHRSTPRPLSTLARGARRTIRTVGGTIARLL
jgi:hypothetical protein